MRRYAIFAIVCFYCFLGFVGFFITRHGPRADGAAQLAAFGAGASATLWWIADASSRRVPIPYLSLWTGLYWYVVIPVHYLSTRGVRGLGKLGFHVLLASV
jgi:hypothetical protein